MAEPPRPELLSFLGAIKADPDEDTPKLALADWLQEQPDAADQARGEFLRQFVRNNQLSKTDPAREDFGALSRLWSVNERAWAGRLKASGFKVWATNHMFRWGLLFPALDWPVFGDEASLAASEEYAWVAGVAVRAADGKAGIGFVNSALLPSLIGLRVAESEGSRGLVGHLCWVAREHRLRSLELAFAQAPIYAVAQSRALGELRHLAVRRVTTAEEFAHLCGSPHLNELRVLDVSGADLDAAAGRAFAEGGGLPALEELNLGHGLAGRFNRIGTDGLRALVSDPRSGRLRRLNVAANGIGTDGVEALCAAPHMCALTYLDLSTNYIGDPGPQALAAAEHLKTLEFLNLSGNGIGSAGARALADSPHLTNIRRLNLRSNSGIDERAEAALRARFGDRVILGYWENDRD